MLESSFFLLPAHRKSGSKVKPYQIFLSISAGAVALPTPPQIHLGPAGKNQQ